MRRILIRTATCILMLLAVSAAVFFALRCAVSDPILTMVSPEVLSANADNIDALRDRLGLNDPLPMQYFRWLSAALRGDFGYSLTGARVADILFPRIYYTFQLTAAALVLSAVIGITAGCYAAFRRGGVFDAVSSAAASVLLALPQFFCGIVLVYTFSVKLSVLPASNRVSPGGGGIADIIIHMILPVAALTLSLSAVVVRYTRAAVLDNLSSDFVRNARARGIPERRILISHALRAGARPVVNLLILRLPMLVSGAVVIESVFSYPGIGLAMTNAVSSGDYPVVTASALIISFVMLLSSYAADAVSAMLDPRLGSGVSA